MSASLSLACAPSERQPAAAPAAPAPTSPSISAGEAGVDLRLRPIVLVGLMGVGKTTVGRSLAAALSMGFLDSDEEVERAADRTVAEIFAERGEAAFRDGERRVIRRLLTQDPAPVIAFGGGAFMDAKTRSMVADHAVSVWLRADIQLLARRVARKTTRPLLIGRDPLEVLRAQAEARHPIYATADVVVDAGEGPSASTVAAVLSALSTYVAGRPSPEAAEPPRSGA